MKLIDYTNIPAVNAEKLVGKLNTYLATLTVFYANLRNFHWNVKGHNFFVLHSETEKLYDNVSDQIDEVAERIKQLSGTPLIGFQAILAETKIKEVPTTEEETAIVENVFESFKILCSLERELFNLSDELEDPTTNGMFAEILAGREKTMWMWNAYLTR